MAIAHLTRWAHGFTPSFCHLLSNMQWSSMASMLSVVSITTPQTLACILFALHRIFRYDSCCELPCAARLPVFSASVNFAVCHLYAVPVVVLSNLPARGGSDDGLRSSCHGRPSSALDCELVWPIHTWCWTLADKVHLSDRNSPRGTGYLLSDRRSILTGTTGPAAYLEFY
jgi:hypothetical protein